MRMIVWDADETLWFGTIFHGSTVELKPETKEVLKQLNKLGIDQIICSRNRIKDVQNQLKQFDITKYFKQIIAKVPIDKAKEIELIIKQEKVNPKEVLFIDDNQLIREHVKLYTGCHVDYSTDLYDIIKYFDTPRLVLMEQQRSRVTAHQNWKGSYKDFLKTVNMTIQFKLASEHELPRITNLINRTNDFNMTRTRYSEQAVTDLYNNPDYTIYVVYMSDKYGDFGLIGEAIIDKTELNSWFIKEICVSCRTAGRGIGTKLVQFIVTESKKEGISKVIGHVLPTKENKAMHALFRRNGFKFVTKDKNKEVYEFDCN